jgi:RNA polymerase II C-terminal domain phosphatase-like 3/4
VQILDPLVHQAFIGIDTLTTVRPGPSVGGFPSLTLRLTLRIALLQVAKSFNMPRREQNKTMLLKYVTHLQLITEENCHFLCD